MPVAQEKRLIPPMKLAGLLHGRWANDLLKAAVELDVFSALTGKGRTASEVAKQLCLDEKGVEILLDALLSMEYVQRDGKRYTLTEISEHYLVKESPLYFGSYILFGKAGAPNPWEQLAEAIKTGKPVAQVNTPEQAEKFFPALAAAIFPLNFTTAQSLADELQVSKATSEVKVLDLAAGSAVWSIPFAQVNPKTKVDALDFPAVLKVTKEFTRKFNVDGQFNYISGAWKEVKIEKGHYDYVILGHILHSEGRELSQEMLTACFEALKPGGKLVIAEFLSNEERSGPLFPRLFEMNMYLCTSGGCVFTVNELKQMLEKAGFRGAERKSLPYWNEESPVMVAQK